MLSALRRSDRQLLFHARSVEGCDVQSRYGSSRSFWFDAEVSRAVPVGDSIYPLGGARFVIITDGFRSGLSFFRLTAVKLGWPMRQQLKIGEKPFDRGDSFSRRGLFFAS